MILVLLPLLAAPPRPAAAQSRVPTIDTVEAVVGRHPIAVVVRFESQKHYDVDVAVVEQLKGPPLPPRFTIRADTNVWFWGDAQTLVCATPTETPGVVVLGRRYGSGASSAFPLDGSEGRAFDIAALPLRSRNDILAAARAGAAVPHPAPMLETHSTARGHGSAYVTTFVVPRTPAVEAAARRWLTSLDPRAVEHGLYVLSSFGATPENVAAVREAQRSMAPSSTVDVVRWRWSIHDVRGTADQILAGWQLRAPPSNRYEFVTQHSPVRWPRVVVALVAVLAILAAVAARPRERRRLARGAAALSLIGLAAVVALWARSYARSDELVRATAAESQEAWTHRGRFVVATFKPWGRPRPLSYAAFPATKTTVRHAPHLWRPDESRALLGFASMSGPIAGVPGSSGTFRAVVIPMWVACLPCMVAPAWLAAGALRRRVRRTRNVCPTCGYDLRHSAGRCPECGAVTL